MVIQFGQIGDDADLPEVDDTPVDKPGTRVRSDATIRVRGAARRFVSRGGDKLAGALEQERQPLARAVLRREEQLAVADFAKARRNMVDCQLRTNKVTDRALLAAFEETPRERFADPACQSIAYADEKVPMGNGRFLAPPMVLARLLQAEGEFDEALASLRSALKLDGTLGGAWLSLAQLQKFQTGLSIMENAIPIPQGGAEKRPGTKYIAEVKTSSLKTRLLPFQFSTSQSYIIEAGNQYMRFFTSGAAVTAGAGTERRE